MVVFDWWKPSVFKLSLKHEASLGELNPIEINDYSTTNISEDCFGYLNGYEFKKKEKIKIKYLNSQGIEKSINLNKKTFE